MVYDAKGARIYGGGGGRPRPGGFFSGISAGSSVAGRAPRAAGCSALGELDFASLHWRGRIVAVTGTNGKTTLTEFLAHALRSAGRDANVAGNVGHAFSGLVAATAGGTGDMTAICEVSSFQAETLQYFRADSTLWTNFAEDHLERHAGMAAYFAAKSVLAARSDQVFAGSSVRVRLRILTSAAEVNIRNLDPFKTAVWVDSENQPADSRLTGTVFADYPQRENFLLAAAWWRAQGWEMSALYAAADSFRLGRHRLARVAEIGGVTFWNDSKATNFHAVEAALARFSAPVLLVAGGKAKGGDLSGFVHRIAPRVRRAFLIGETRATLAGACVAAGLPHTLCATLADAVHAAAEVAGPGDHVLLSPAFSSFDMFRNYEDRGEQFERLVREQILAAPASIR